MERKLLALGLLTVGMVSLFTIDEGSNLNVQASEEEDTQTVDAETLSEDAKEIIQYCHAEFLDGFPRAGDASYCDDNLIYFGNFCQSEPDELPVWHYCVEGIIFDELYDYLSQRGLSDANGPDYYVPLN